MIRTVRQAGEGRRRRLARLLPLCVGLTAGDCDLREAFRGRVEVAARANAHALTVERLAATVAAGRNIPAEPDVVARWTHRWVEYSLFAQRIAAGDSLLDSATVVRAAWPSVYGALVTALHDRLVGERLDLAWAVDSAYAAGDHRLIRHVLIRTRPDMTAAERLEARRRAEAVWGRLVNGGAWQAANALNEDPGAQARGGSVGVIARGQTAPDFEAAAFALRPGELSEVTATGFGYHVIHRPRLEDVRAEYAAAIEQALVQRLDSLYLADLEGRWRIRVRRGAAPLMREVAQAPYLGYGSDRVLATYGGGAFTVADFVRWLFTRPAREQQLVPMADDRQLAEFLGSLVRNEVLLHEARAAGLALDDSTFRALRDTHADQLWQLRAALALDSALAGAAEPDARRRAAEQAADRYMERLAHDLQDAVFVPPFLADRLRETAAWSVSYAGLEQALARAAALRARAEQGVSDG